MKTLIREKAACLVEETVNNAVDEGGEILIDGKWDGVFYESIKIANATEYGLQQVFLQKTIGLLCDVLVK